jgi:hypothetical protein
MMISWIFYLLKSAAAPVPGSPQQLYGGAVRHSTITDDMPVLTFIKDLLNN